MSLPVSAQIPSLHAYALRAVTSGVLRGTIVNSHPLPKPVVQSLASSILSSPDATVAHLRFMEGLEVLDCKDCKGISIELLQHIINQSHDQLTCIRFPRFSEKDLAKNELHLNLPFDRLRELHIPESLPVEAVRALFRNCGRDTAIDFLVIESFEHLQVLLEARLKVMWLKLDIHSCSSFTDEELRRVSESYGEVLVCLEILNCKLITSFSGCYFPNLSKLDASLTGITNDGLKTLETVAPHLLELCIAECNTITNMGGCRLQELRYLRAVRTSLTDDGLRHLSRSSPLLEWLNINLCNNISTFEGCEFTNLKKLSVSSSLLTNAGIEALSRCAPDLQELCLHGCTRVSFSRAKLFAFFKHLHSLL